MLVPLHWKHPKVLYGLGLTLALILSGTEV